MCSGRKGHSTGAVFRRRLEVRGWRLVSWPKSPRSQPQSPTSDLLADRLSIIIVGRTVMSHHDEEFAALRATIRERGTVRMVLLPVTLGIWGATAVATMAAIQLPIAALLPLLVLTG